MPGFVTAPNNSTLRNRVFSPPVANAGAQCFVLCFARDVVVFFFFFFFSMVGRGLVVAPPGKPWRLNDRGTVGPRGFVEAPRRLAPPGGEFAVGFF